MAVFLTYRQGSADGRAARDSFPADARSASNFFELAMTAGISLLGFQSGAALATVMGALIEVPVMLAVVAVVRRHVALMLREHLPDAAPSGTGGGRAEHRVAIHQCPASRAVRTNRPRMTAGFQSPLKAIGSSSTTQQETPNLPVSAMDHQCPSGNAPPMS